MTESSVAGNYERYAERFDGGTCYHNKAQDTPAGRLGNREASVRTAHAVYLLAVREHLGPLATLALRLT